MRLFAVTAVLSALCVLVPSAGAATVFNDREASAYWMTWHDADRYTTVLLHGEDREAGDRLNVEIEQRRCDRATDTAYVRRYAPAAVQSAQVRIDPALVQGDASGVLTLAGTDTVLSSCGHSPPTVTGSTDLGTYELAVSGEWIATVRAGLGDLYVGGGPDPFGPTCQRHAWQAGHPAQSATTFDSDVPLLWGQDVEMLGPAPEGGLGTTSGVDLTGDC